MGVLTIVIGCRGDSLVTPPASVAGVWSGRLPIGAPTDSILLILDDSTPRVPALGYFSPLRGDGLVGVGNRAGARVSLSLAELFPPAVGGQRVSIFLDVELQSDQLRGRARAFGMDQDVVLRRADGLPGGAAGQWVLRTIRLLPAGQAPGLPSDTLALAPDGRARWSRDGESCGFSQRGVARQRGEWVLLEYVPITRAGAACGFTAMDSLRTVGDSLVRSVRLFGGSVEQEIYTRR